MLPVKPHRGNRKYWNAKRERNINIHTNAKNRQSSVSGKKFRPLPKKKEKGRNASYTQSGSLDFCLNENKSDLNTFQMRDVHDDRTNRRKKKLLLKSQERRERIKIVWRQ